MDDFSFRFGEGESLKGVWSVVRKRKIGIMMAGCSGPRPRARGVHGPEPAISGHCDHRSGQHRCLADESAPECPRRAPSSDEMKTNIATHMHVLQSPNVLLGVVRDLKLQDEAPFKFTPTLMGAITGIERAH